MNKLTQVQKEQQKTRRKYSSVLHFVQISQKDKDLVQKNYEERMKTFIGRRGSHRSVYLH